MSNGANYTRSLRDAIKAKKAELKELEVKAKEQRVAKKAVGDAGKEARTLLVTQVAFVLQEQPEQTETATALLDGLFSKRELADEFKAFRELSDEKRESFKTKMAERKAAKAAK